MVKDVTKDNNIVVEEVQKGYKLNNIVIRPSKAKVNQIN
jgi:molecular chaperone GrpE